MVGAAGGCHRGATDCDSSCRVLWNGQRLGCKAQSRQGYVVYLWRRWASSCDSDVVGGCDDGPRHWRALLLYGRVCVYTVDRPRRGGSPGAMLYSMSNDGTMGAVRTSHARLPRMTEKYHQAPRSIDPHRQADQRTTGDPYAMGKYIHRPFILAPARASTDTRQQRVLGWWLPIHLLNLYAASLH